MPELTLNISPPPPPTLVLDISPPQGPEGPQGDTGPQGPTGPAGPQPDLSADTPEDLGTAAAGVSMEASRSDHVHAMPSAADVGALPVELIGLTPEQTDRGAWDENETYTLGDVVFSGGFWVGVAPVVGSHPGDVSGEWDMFLPSTHIGVGTDIGGIGVYSTAVGVFSHASGTGSTALGFANRASGDGSTALGHFVEASGEGSTALGFVNRASGDGSTALGLGNQASGEGSTALGYRAEASGDYSTALGYRAEASGDGDVNLAKIITGHIDTNTYLADALTLPTGFADLPHTDASSNPNVDSSRLIARSDGLAVRDNAGTETKLVVGTDARLTDARTPLAHTHGQSDVTGLVADMAGKQPLDSDLTAIAALSTTAFGRSLLEVVDAVGGRAALSAAAATHVHSGADITSGAAVTQWLGPITGRVHDSGYYAPRGEVSGAVTVPHSAGAFLAQPIWLWAGTYTFVGIAYYYNTGTATWRVGLYQADGPSGVAGSLVQDFGTVGFVAGSGAGERSKSISVTLTTGWYWLATLVDSYTSAPSVTGFGQSTNGPLGPLNGITSQGSTANPSALYATGVATGALPATAPNLGASSPAGPSPCWRLYRPTQ